MGQTQFFLTVRELTSQVTKQIEKQWNKIIVDQVQVYMGGSRWGKSILSSLYIVFTNASNLKKFIGQVAGALLDLIWLKKAEKRT